MKDILRKLQLMLGLLVVVGGYVVYRQISQDPMHPSLNNCVIAWLELSLLFLLLYVSCLISCAGSGDEPIKPQCIYVCSRFLYYTQALLIVLLVACLWAARPWQ